MNKNTVLSLHNINKSFDGKVKVSEDISFTLNKGEILSLLGSFWLWKNDTATINCRI
ncbi:Uncharacterised protein [Proteus vulgaris]|nr:Uncharacterised protein [Proteus vulgaris]